MDDSSAAPGVYTGTGNTESLSALSMDHAMCQCITIFEITRIDPNVLDVRLLFYQQRLNPQSEAKQKSKELNICF